MPQLRTGWEPDTPVDDLLLRQAVLNFTDFNAGTSEALGGRVRWTDDLALADLGRPSPFMSSATFLRPPVPDMDALMDEIHAFFANSGGHVDLWSAWPTGDLSSRGWALQGHPPLMFRTAGPGAADLPDGLDIVEVHDQAQLEDFEEAVKTGFGAPEDAPSVLDKRVLDDERLKFWIGLLDERVAATSAVSTSRGVNGVQMVTTQPHLRGRGLGAAMTWKATLADPELPAVLLASDLGRPVYERMGYVALLRFTYWKLERE